MPFLNSYFKYPSVKSGIYFSQKILTYVFRISLQFKILNSKRPALKETLKDPDLHIFFFGNDRLKKNT